MTENPAMINTPHHGVPTRMTTVPAFARRRGAPEDHDIPLRMRRLGELGISLQPVAEFDQFATRIAEAAEAPYAMVNFVTEDEQFFAGLHAPTRAAAEALDAARASAQTSIGRTMTRDRGFCPHVAALKLARVLDDVCQSSRWYGNPVVNDMHIRSYIGAPLMDPDTGVALGTVCAVSNEISNWGKPGLTMIKSLAAELTGLIMDTRIR